MKAIISSTILSYLRFLAKIQLKKNNPTIIGITGTAGKTSTLHALEAVFKDHCIIKVSHKANSESGIPLHILGITPKEFTPFEWLKVLILAPIKVLTNWEEYQYYIAEMAIDSPFPPKNMSYLLTIIHPTIGIFLNARPMHSLGFDALVEKGTSDYLFKEKVTDLIAKEKGKLITSLPPQGLAILNQDDPRVAPLAEHTRAHTQFFGVRDDATIQILGTESSLAGTTFTFQYLMESIRVHLPHYLLPEHYAYSLAPAIIAGIHSGLSLQTCADAIKKNFHPPQGRSTLIKGHNDSLILDSSYNASAQAMIDTLDLLRLSKGRKLALLGDMRELGKLTKDEHLVVAKHAASICDEAYLVGPAMKEYALPFLEKKGCPVLWFETAYQAAHYLKTILKKNDMLVVKGSQNTLFLEIAVEILMAKPGEAAKLLCRRGKFWDKQRAPYLH